MDIDLRKDITIIPLGNNSNIVYAPLRGVAFLADDKAADIFHAYTEGVNIINTPETAILSERIQQLEQIIVKQPRQTPINLTSNLVIIISQMCNLACSYCYAQDSRSREKLNKDQMKVAIDYIFSQKSQHKNFSFIGGGEPTLTWDLLKWAIEYIRSYPFNQKDTHIGITTNGTLLNEEKIDFIKAHSVTINLSFEILPDIQNFQRCFADSNKKSFDLVNALIYKLIEENVSISIRSTITNLNVGRMPEMVSYVIEHYPSIKKLHFEQVTSIDNNIAFYDDFIHYFLLARKIGLKKGIDVYCSASRGIMKLKYNFCNGEFCLTPSGDFVACHRISSKEEVAFSSFKFAEINDNGVSVNETKKKSIENFINQKNKECSSCFAKWHCGGSCPMERTIYSPEMRDLKCYFTKELTKALILERINSHSRSHK